MQGAKLRHEKSIEAIVRGFARIILPKSVLIFHRCRTKKLYNIEFYKSQADEMINILLNHRILEFETVLRIGYLQRNEVHNYAFTYRLINPSITLISKPLTTRPVNASCNTIISFVNAFVC